MGAHQIAFEVGLRGDPKARCVVCDWQTNFGPRAEVERSVARHLASLESMTHRPRAAYVCRAHPSEAVTWKGTGCRLCADELAHRARRRRRRLGRADVLVDLDEGAAL